MQHILAADSDSGSYMHILAAKLYAYSQYATLAADSDSGSYMQLILAADSDSGSYIQHILGADSDSGILATCNNIYRQW